MSSDAGAAGSRTQDRAKSWRQRLAEGRQEGSFWENGTRDYVARMSTKPVLDQRPELKNYIHWIEQTATRTVGVEPQLFLEFCEQFARIAKVLGAPGDMEVIGALDRAVELLRSLGVPATSLLLAKAACSARTVTDHPGRLEALTNALNSVDRGSAEWADIMLAMSQYYTDVSQYDRALAAVSELRNELPSELLTARYECGASIYESYAKITSMRDLAGADRDLERALAFEPDAVRDREVAMWVSMGYYRKGFLAQLQRDYSGAILHYMNAMRVREIWARDPRTFGFMHLRIAESFMSDGLLSDARKHLDIGRRLFEDCSDRGSGWLQCCVAYANLEIAAGQPESGITALEQASDDAHEIGFYRGELLCLGRLVILRIRRHEFKCLIVACGRIARTVLRGEVRRNGWRNIIRKAPLAVKLLRSR